MTTAILLAVCLVLAGAVVALAAVLTSLRRQVERLGRAIESPGLVTGASASSPTGEGGPLPTSPTGGGVAEEFVITRLGEEPDDEPAPTLETRLFADIVLRESVVKAASFAHGVRRGLSPANRNRIWFEMRREVKRARKQRRVVEREAVREWRARQRAALREDDAA